MIIPSDIAFVISVIKNARHVWDQTIRKIGLGEPLGDGETEAKVQPIFTKGTGKKKEQGRSLWSDKGMKYFRCMEKVWKKVYKHKTMMVDLYRGFDKWTSMGAKSLYQKTRQSLCFQWWQVLMLWQFLQLALVRPVFVNQTSPTPFLRNSSKDIHDLFY